MQVGGRMHFNPNAQEFLPKEQLNNVGNPPFVTYPINRGDFINYDLGTQSLGNNPYINYAVHPHFKSYSVLNNFNAYFDSDYLVREQNKQLAKLSLNLMHQTLYHKLAERNSKNIPDICYLFNKLNFGNILTMEEKRNIEMQIHSISKAISNGTKEWAPSASGSECPEKEVLEHSTPDPKKADFHSVINTRETFHLETSVSPMEEVSESRDLNYIFKPDDLFKTVVFHFVGACGYDPKYPMNFKIICSDGAVSANRDLLMAASSYIFNRARKDCQDSLVIPYLTAHAVGLVVTLVTHGRVVVLQSRLAAFKKSIEFFNVPGVFDSGEVINGDEFSESINLEVFAGDVQGFPDRIMCFKCNNVVLKSTYGAHYEEYHTNLRKRMECCGFVFSTKYEYVTHKFLMCNSSSLNKANFSNIQCSVDASAVAVDLSVERLNRDKHSTPFEITA